LSNSTFKVLISLWTISAWCKYKIAYAVSYAIDNYNSFDNFFLKGKFSKEKLYFYLCNKLKRQPLSAYSLTIHKLGGLFTIAINYIKLGCLLQFNISTSLLNSAISSYVITGLNIFFIQTIDPLNFPLWTTLNPPWAIFLPN